MIETRELVKCYGGLRAVDKISFTVAKGDVLGFLGPNGAGKTTTMRMITGAIAPTSGNVIVGGYDVEKDPIRAKSRIGYLPENPPLYNEMTTWSYLSYVAELKGVGRNIVNSKVQAALDVCGLGEVRNRVIGNLSKGYRQRIGIAQALVHDPDVLILDEPTSGLDPKQITEIRSLILSLKGERTIILSSHILPEIQMTCDRVIILNKGRIVAVEHTDKNNSYEITLSKIDHGLFGILRSFDGVMDVGTIPGRDNAIYVDTNSSMDIRAELIKGMVNGNYEVLEFRNRQASLEDMFLRLTAKETDQA